MNIELNIEDQRWTALNLDVLCERSVAAICARLDLDPDPITISVLAADDARIAVLNRDFRGKPTPTNVLSWPAEDLSPETPGGAPMPPEVDMTGEMALGDVALAWETCIAEAKASDLSEEAHVTHLVVHGILHLLGYDHIADEDASRMEGLETEILGSLGIANPY